MTILLTNAGEIRILDLFVAGAGLNLYLCLYQNSDFDPDADSLIGDVDPATFSGYPTNGTRITFGAAATVSSKGTIIADPISFVRASGPTSNTIYGYYVVHFPSGGSPLLLWAEEFATPQALTTVGQTIIITPAFTLNSE